VQIDSDTGTILKDFLSNGTIISVNITDSDVNNWTSVLQGGPAIVAMVLCGVPAIINIFIALYKMQAHVRSYGCKPTIAQIVFWIDILANLLRIWFIFVSRNFASGVMFVFSTMASSLSWPLNIITVLLVSIKWNELTSANNVKQSLFLSTYRKPFLIVSGLMFLVELVSTTTRGLNYPIEILAGVSWALLMICTVTVCIMLWYYGTKVLRHLRKVEESGAASGGGGKMRAMRRATIGMMIAGGFLFLVVIAFLFSIIAQFSVKRTLLTSIIFVVVSFIALDLASMVQLLSFPTPSRKMTDLGQTRSEKRTTTSGGTSNGSSQS
jgi:hypothetical protein